MRNIKGITLIALIITIILLIILASVATYSGKQVINSAKLTAFTAELKIMQTQVNRIYEEYNGIDQYGNAIEGKVEEQAKKVFSELEKDTEEGINGYVGYRYWSNEEIKRLGIEGVKEDFFVNLEKRSIVSYKGLEYEGKTYYTLNQVPDNLYNVKYEEKDAEKPTFDVDIEKIGREKWRVNITNIQYSGYINKWQVKYRLEEKDYWNTTEDLSFVINEEGKYQLQIQNELITSEVKIFEVEVEVEVGRVVTKKNRKYTNNGTAVIPVGFTIVPGCEDISEGLVISDDEGDTEIDPDNKISNGNQFVWVTVLEIDKFKAIEGYNDKILDNKLPDCSEPFNEGYNTEEEEYQAMYESVRENQGFYIGRYEAGKEKDKVVVKKNMIVYNEVIWGNSMNDSAGGAVECSKNFATEKGYSTVTSTLCYGVQWDATMQFFDSDYINGTCSDDSYVRNSTGRGVYAAEGPMNTGINDYYQEKHIYDMAGNVREWTMEAGKNTSRISRGGGYSSYGSGGPASNRHKYNPNESNDNVGFRIALYLNNI